MDLPSKVASYQNHNRMRVSNQEFVTRLTTLLSESATKNSVYISQKRYTREDASGDVQMTPASTSTSQADQFSILFRATNGSSDPSKKIKFSTLVSPSDLSSFQASYLPALRTSLSTSLRKRDKAKERKVDKLLAQQKKKIEEDGGKVKIGGKKRGAGHRKRQRDVKKASKLRAEKAKASEKAAAVAAISSSSTSKV